MPDRTQLVLQPETRELIEHVKDGHRYHKPDHETVTLIPSESSRVEAVQRLFKDYLAGVPFRILRDNLNATGLRTVMGGIFTVGTLHTILRNPAYKGTLYFNRCTVSKWHRYIGGTSIERHDEGEEKRAKEDWIVVPEAWPALVDAQTFDAVQAKLAEAREANVHTRTERADWLSSQRRLVLRYLRWETHGADGKSEKTQRRDSPSQAVCLWRAS